MRDGEAEVGDRVRHMTDKQTGIVVKVAFEKTPPPLGHNETHMVYMVVPDQGIRWVKSWAAYECEFVEAATDEEMLTHSHFAVREAHDERLAREDKRNRLNRIFEQSNRFRKKL